MTDAQWKIFFLTCARVLGKGARFDWGSETWCCWTTFGALSTSVGYWTAGLPNEENICDTGTSDNGPWGQPFLYRDLAHIIIPREFFWERTVDKTYTNGTRTQDLARLSAALTENAIPHRLTDLVLEIKLY